MSIFLISEYGLSLLGEQNAENFQEIDISEVMDCIFQTWTDFDLKFTHSREAHQATTSKIYFDWVNSPGLTRMSYKFQRQYPLCFRFSCFSQRWEDFSRGFHYWSKYCFLWDCIAVTHRPHPWLTVKKGTHCISCTVFHCCSSCVSPFRRNALLLLCLRTISSFPHKQHSQWSEE